LPAVEVQWEPAPERRIPLPAPLGRDDDGPLVGRTAALDQLSRCWEEARAGRRRVAMLVGEPGIGKTRLAAEFCRRAYSEGALVLLGRCYEESLIPYQPFVEALRSYVVECPLDELRLQIGPHRRMLARLVPELADPSLQPADDPFFAASEREQFLLFDAVASLLGAVAGEHALIVVLDDLHWADAPTLLLLRHVARVLEGDRLLVLGTYRQTEVDDAHPLSQTLAELRRARALDSLAISGLGEEDVAALISSRSEGDVPAGLVRSIVERTEGNPFFVEEVLREGAADGDALARIPESVKDLLLRRMRQLDDDCKRLLTFAAVTGHEFTLDVLESVSGAAPDTLVETIERAIAAHIVDETASIGRFTFAHALIRETIYEQLSFTRRAQLHRLIGAAIESQEHDRPAELAYHFSAAGNVAKAYEYHSLAAVAAERMYAIEPTLSHCTAAIEAADRLGLNPDREPALRRLLLQRGRMRFRTGDRRAGADYESALASARRSGDRVTELDALNELALLQLGSDVAAGSAFSEAALAIAEELADPVALTTTLDRLGVISSNQLEFSRGIELGERALELARPTGDPNLIARAIDSIKLAVWQLGDLHRLEELTAELEPIWRERGELWFLQFTLLESAFVPIGAARWEQAAERLAEAAAINRRIRDPAAEVLILDAFCWLHRSRGAYDEALSAGRRAIAHGPATGLWEGWAASTLGWLLLDLGAADDAAEVLERGLKSAERIRSANQTTRCMSQLAWARSLLGDVERASALAGHAAELLDRVSAPPGSAFLFGAQAYAALARVYLDRGEAERGEALLLPVLRAAERCGWLEAAAATELVVGLCLEARGEVERAITTLAHAAEVADRAGIPASSWEAHGALGRVLRAAGRPGEADEHAANAAATVERLCGEINDDALRDRLRERASR
jgi:tetratricopeptide (TPR) repeat protein